MDLFSAYDEAFVVGAGLVHPYINVLCRSAASIGWFFSTASTQRDCIHRLETAALDIYERQVLQLA
jgi:hypothetical protein